MKRFLAILILLLSAGAVRADITSNLVAHWKLDETSGTVAADSSGNGNTGGLAGGNTFADLTIAGPNGMRGIDLDGTADWVSDTTVTGMPTDYPVTLAAWVKSDGVAGRIASCANPSFKYVFFQSGVTGIIQIAHNATGDIITTTTVAVTTGTWEHFVVVFTSATEFLVYKNGSLAATHSGLTSVAFPSSAYVVAGNLYSGYVSAPWNGGMSQVRIYSRALSAADVAELYAYTGAAKFPYWYFHNSGLRRNPFDAFTVRQPLAILKTR